MDDVGGMEEFESAEDLVNEVLDMLGQQLLARANHTAQVGLHQLTHEVDVAEDFSVHKSKGRYE